MLYPPPPRKQPGERSWGSTQEENRNKASGEGSQGSRRKCEQSTRTKRLHCGWEHPSSGRAFCFHKADVGPAALLPRSRTPASRPRRDLQDRNPRPPESRRRACSYEWPLELLGLQSKEATPQQGSCVLGRASETPHTILLHLWCSLWFLFFFLITCFGWGLGGGGEDK